MQKFFMIAGKKQILWKLKKSDGTLHTNLSISLIKAWIIEGKIVASDFLCNSEQPEWQSPNTFAEFQELIGKPDTNGVSSKNSRSEDSIVGKDMGFGWQPAQLEEVEMDMTPMMDCTFLLLIFFVVTATFAIHEAKNIQIPKAMHTTPVKQERETLTVAVTKDREIYFCKKIVSLRSLCEQIKQEVNRTSQQDVILSADQSLEYGYVVEVMDEINAAGVKNIKVKLEKRQK